MRTGLCVLALAGASLAQQVRINQQHTAKIVLEDGTPFSTTPEIIPAINGQGVAACVLDVFGGGTVQYVVRNQSDPFCHGSACLDGEAGDSCPVRIRLAGYRTTEATLHQGAVIVLKRIGDNEGTSVSITAVNAPKDAKKAYESGVAAMAHQKWDVAQKDFERAVAEYPKYAPAWSDLGEALMQDLKPQEARAACEHALEADPRYLKPYLQLARLALSEGRIEDAAHITTRALALNPVEFPGLYYYDAVADLRLKRLDDAERSARRAIELDPNHEIPIAESLLGTLLAAKGDRSGAIEHYRKYLQISPKATDADTVRRRIAELEAAAQK
ncbi:MAG: tetratricopeptide repeat protein [Bryobacteraceae bacterium]